MKYENRSGGYGMRGDGEAVEAARLSCPVCGKWVARGDDEDTPVPCPHLRFFCAGETGRMIMWYFGSWDTVSFEREWIRRLGWRKREDSTLTERHVGTLLVDPVEAARELDEEGFPLPLPDENGHRPGQDRRFRDAFKGWAFPGLSLIRRADPQGGCLVGSPLPLTLIGFGGTNELLLTNRRRS